MSAAVTAVIPTRNRAGLLATTLRSILAQRETELEVIVIDDGSDPAVAQDIAALAGGPVRVVRNHTSRGVAEARNMGVEAARTAWVAFCDDDDLWTPGKIAAQVAAAESGGVAWAYTGAVKFEQGPRIWQLMAAPDPQEVARRLAHKCVIPAGASNVLADRRTVLDVGGFDPMLMHMADWDMWLRLLEHGPPAAVDGIRVAYRLHPGTMSLRPAGILEELATLDDRWRHLRGGLPLDPAPTHLWIAMSHLRAGQRRQAALSYLRAARTRPRPALRGALRSLHPAPPSPAHRTELSGHDRPVLKRVQLVELPAEARLLLRELASDEAPEGGPGESET